MKRLSLFAVALGVLAVGCSQSSTSPRRRRRIRHSRRRCRPPTKYPPITGAEAGGSGTSTVTFGDHEETRRQRHGPATATFVVNLSGFPAGTPINIAHIHQAAAGVNGAVSFRQTLTAGQVVLATGSGSLHGTNRDGRRCGASRDHREQPGRLLLQRALDAEPGRRRARPARQGRSIDAIHSPPCTPQCVVAGGGPAGMMLGLLLARAGVDVAVLEKHADFLRDFRGDTIHPSTLELMHELGILDAFLKRPHQEVRS